MNLLFALVIGALFGGGVHLLLKADLFRVVAGVVLISNAANLTLMASGVSRGQAPIQPTRAGESVADPLVQAMTLTALVIGFAVTALLLALAFGVYRARRSVDLDELSRQQADEAARLEALEAPHDEEREIEAEEPAGDYDEALPVTLIAVPLAVLWPVAIALALLDGRRRAPALAGVAALAATFVLLAVLLARVAADGPQEARTGGWAADVGIRLRVDALGTVFALLSCGVLLASLLQAVATGAQARATPALTLFMALGLTGLFLTGDVFSFYVFFELAMIAAYALTAAGGDARRVDAALIFAVVNLLGSFLFLIAIGALYRATGTLEMLAVAERAAPIDPNTAILLAITFFVAFGIKLGLFPFHFWLPSVYLAVPPHVSAMFAGALANIGAYGLLRFGGALLPRELALSATALIVLGTISIAYGALQAIARRDTREVLAYSSIGHAGYVLVALGLGGPVGLGAAVIFSVGNALSKTLLFLTSELRGRVMAFGFLIGVLSVAGVPPTAGFFGKAALFEAGVDAGSVAVVVLLFVGGALSFVYLFQIHQHDRWRPREERDRSTPTERASRGQRAVALGVALVVLALGVWPEPLLAVGEQAAAGLIGQEEAR